MWGMSAEYMDYAERMRGEAVEDRKEAVWMNPKAEAGVVMVVDLDLWTLTGADNGALFFTRHGADMTGVPTISESDGA